MNKTAFGNLSKTYKNEGKVEGEILDSIKTHLSTTKGNPHKVTASDVGAYNKDEVDSKIDVISSEVGNRYTKEEVDNKISEIGGSVDAYTKAETDELLSDKADKEKTETDIGMLNFKLLGLPTFNDVYTKAETDELLSSKADIQAAYMLTYALPSTGLDIQNGVVVGIGTCRDENIIIPEIDGEGNTVYKVDDFVFSSLLGSEGGFIKRIIFPSSIRSLGINVLSSKYCPNLSAVFIMNPNMEWMANQTFMLSEKVKDIFLGFSREKWVKLNTVINEYSLISLHDDNIAAGIVPDIHYSHFITSAAFENAIGDIDSALDELHGYAASLIGGGA